MDMQRFNHLRGVLNEVSNKSASKEKLEYAINILEKAAASGSGEQPDESYEDLVLKYKKSQAALKQVGTSKKKPLQVSSDPIFFSLNFARFRRQLKGFRKTSTNIQVIGFTDNDSYQDTLSKACNGLSLRFDPSVLTLMCSGGIVPDSPIGGNKWTLGEFIRRNGGSKNRSKKVWGVYVPVGFDEAEMTTSDSEYVCNKKASLKRTSSFLFPTPTTKEKRPCDESECVTIISSSGSDLSTPIFISMHNITVKYSPIIFDKLHTSVIGVGQIGVWRITELDYITSNESICEKLFENNCFQPEVHDFYVTEICQGSTEYLKCDITVGSTVAKNEVKYLVKDGRVLLSERVQKVYKQECARLLVVSPDHGKTKYTWEKTKDEVTWVHIDVPSDTCLLYTKDQGMYSCEVSGEVYYFEVLDDSVLKANPESDHDDLCFSIKEVQFGDVIGRGSFGVVYQGKWKGNEVALKTIRLPAGVCISALPIPDEVSILKSLQHPNIIKFIGYCVTKESIVLMTNFVNGNNLDILIFSKSYKLAERTAVDISVKIADAVNYMHLHDPIVIHQDLKPANVMVSRNYKDVFLCDMGIARVKQLTETTVTCSSKGPGTYPYMAPKQFTKSHRGPALDIYSLGCLYIELFGGQRVWRQLDGPNIMLKVLGSYNTPPQQPCTSHLMEVYSDLCSRMCNLEPTLRPSSTEVLKTLKKISSK